MQLTPQILLHGYSIGIFPMAEHRDDPEVFWVDPRRRGILPLDRFHVSRSLSRAMRRSDWHITLNQDFAGVVAACADRDETWINDEIARLYDQLHAMARAHSVEIRSADGALVGGVYGVTLGAAFFGESMFSRATNGSKMALAAAVDHLRRLGFMLFDTQFLTDHLASLGAVEITRAKYHALLERALEGEADFTAAPAPRLYDVMQRMTQTS